MSRMPVAAHAFSEAAGRWVPRGLDEGPIELESLTVVTQNVWFDPHEKRARTRALLERLEGSDADLIAIQEVTDDVFETLRATEWIREEVSLVPHTSGPGRSYEVAWLSRLPVARAFELELESLMGRTLLVVELATTRGIVAVATVHLESERPMRAARVAQLEEIFDALDRYPAAVLCGDLNFDPSEPEQGALDPAYHDAWVALHGEAAGYTEDTTRNTMRFLRKGKHKHVRYDRILGRMPGWRVDDASLFADAPIAEDLFVSDHFGVRARLVRR